MVTLVNRSASLTCQDGHGDWVRHGRAGTGTVHRAAAPDPGSPGQSTAPVPVPPALCGPGRAAPGRWPLHSFLELGALPGAVPCARLHCRAVLWEWGLDGFGDQVEMVVSELTGNAVTVSAGLTRSQFRGQRRAGRPPVRLWVCSDRTRVLVQVWDGSGGLPEVQEADPLAESGRGLLLVASMSQDWGSYPLRGSSGKCVWALLGELPSSATGT